MIGGKAKLLRADLAIAIGGGTLWGIMQASLTADNGGSEAVIAGVLNGLLWGAVWMAVSVTRELIRSRSIAARERRSELAAPLPPDHL